MKNIDLEITQTKPPFRIDTQQLRRTADHVLERLNCTHAVISLAVVDHNTIIQLQQQYFDRTETTDVLSFDLREKPHLDNELDGEIIINAQCALEVAQTRRLDQHAELNLYLVHGLLHLLGFDDQSPSEAQIMHQKEDQLLQELGFGKVFQSGNGER